MRPGHDLHEVERNCVKELCLYFEIFCMYFETQLLNIEDYSSRV